MKPATRWALAVTPLPFVQVCGVEAMFALGRVLLLGVGR